MKKTDDGPPDLDRIKDRIKELKEEDTRLRELRQALEREVERLQAKYYPRGYARMSDSERIDK